MKTLILACTLFVLSSCTKPTSTSHAYYETEGVPHEMIDGLGYKVVIGEDVHFKRTTVSVTGQPTTEETTVNGLPYSLENGKLTIGSISLEIPEGAEVAIQAKGISINGEYKCPLPAN